jgi:hypothetical protein
MAQCDTAASGNPIALSGREYEELFIQALRCAASQTHNAILADLRWYFVKNLLTC